MLHRHVPVLHHLGKLSNAALYKFLLVIIRGGNNGPEEIGHSLLEVKVFGVSAKFRDSVKFIGRHFFCGNLFDLIKYIVNMWLL
jgi:hypothetical protein